MNDPEQFVLLHEIMELKEEMIGWLELDLTSAIVVSATLLVAVNLSIWILYRQDPWLRDYMIPLSIIVSIAVSIVLVLSAWMNQNTMEEYRMLCETYRTLYGPLPWEAAW